jgi:hypothetical protein
LKIPNIATQNEQRCKLRPVRVFWPMKHWGGAEREISKEESGDQSPEMTRKEL